MNLLHVNNIAISGSGFIKLNNEFVFPHPEPQIINTLYKASSKLIIFVSFSYIIELNFFFFA